MTLHPRRRALRFKLATTVWLTILWVLLWGDLSVANVLAGVVLALVVAAALPMPAIEFHGRVHLPSVLALLYRFVIELVVASAQVAALALRFGTRPRSAVLRIQLRSHSDLYLTLTAEMISLVPGSIVVEAHRVTGVLYVHTLDLDMVGGAEGARHHALETEARVMRALASDAELAEAGLARSRRAEQPRASRPAVREETGR